MLLKFEVEGFKNFGKKFTMDFTDVRDYQFNEECVKNGVLNKAIIYGKNGVGKSNFGLALFDIVSVLTDKHVSPGLYEYYENADNDSYPVFHYVFKFDTVDIDYTYCKSSNTDLLSERLIVNNEVLIDYDNLFCNGNLEGLKKLVPSLNYEFTSQYISIIKYTVNNSISDAVLPLRNMVHFVNNMLWCRSLNENRYIGYKTSSSDFYKFIFENDNLGKFQDLLHRAGVNEELIKIKDPDGEERLYFKKIKPLPFAKTASNGTIALYTFFYWLTTAKNLSFLFIDEFDAYYHFELSELIVQMLKEHTEFQSILTTHNTNLLTNRLMRPDCYFILTEDRLTSLVNSTWRELRQGHNLEKLYMSGDFDEKQA